jgi:phosphate transport system substrate-binding protein
VQKNYQSIGSGGFIQQLKKGLVGACDAALDDNQLKQMHHLQSAELKEPLRLSASTLAAIFLGKIKNWQDPAIKKDNPGVSIPNPSMIVAHRSDGSGTTNVFTTYLAKVSPDWEKQVGKRISVNWPTGLGGKGSEGVTGVVKANSGRNGLC